MSAFFIEFEISSEARLAPLVAVFDALRHAKHTDTWPDALAWRPYFDAEARAHFWWPTPEEAAEYWRRWYARPASERSFDSGLDTPWDFDSMIEAFRNGEYDLLACRRVSATLGRLEFDPHAGPYGGTDCMHALIEAFGHRVVRDEG